MIMVERRDQQNAADAAALAGARYVRSAPNFAGPCTSAGGNAAASAACEVALANNFDDSKAAQDVTVHIPPTKGEFRGFPGFVQVDIASRSPSIFGGIMGQSEWPVSVIAVAADQPGVTYTFGMLALNETACKAIHISGSGTVNAAANVQSNSDGSSCGTPPYGLSRTGTGVLKRDGSRRDLSQRWGHPEPRQRLDELRTCSIFLRAAGPACGPTRAREAKPGGGNEGSGGHEPRRDSVEHPKFLPREDRRTGP